MTDDNQALMLALQAGSMYGPNKYSQFPNGIQSTAYSGAPTNALGQPIQAPPGMTLNQTPAQPQAAPAASQGLEALGSSARAMQDSGYGDWGMLDQTLAQSSIPGQTAQPGSVGYQEANYDKTGPQMMTMPMAGTAASGAAAAPQASQGAPGTPANSYQNALQLLSNPGHITTPGATVPQSQPVTQQPSVLNQFLNNSQPKPAQDGSTGAGGYSNQGFFDTLNKLKALGTGGASVSTSLSPSSTVNSGATNAGVLT